MAAEDGSTKEVWSDRTFMMRIMNFEPCLFQFASLKLRSTDFEMATLALSSKEFARTHGRGPIYDQTFPRVLPRKARAAFLARAVEYCANYDAFMLFLCCLRSPGHGNDALLPLNQLGIKQVVSDYVLGLRFNRKHILLALENCSLFFPDDDKDNESAYDEERSIDDLSFLFDDDDW